MISNEQEKALENHFFNKIDLKTLKNKLGLYFENYYDLGLELLKLAYINKNDYALGLGLRYISLNERCLNLEVLVVIRKLYFGDSEWHNDHEDIVEFFSRIISCEFIDFLYDVICWKHEFLSDFENQTIIRRAFYGLGRNISCPKALNYLNQFKNDPDPTLRGFANEQFDILGIKF